MNIHQHSMKHFVLSIAILLWSGNALADRVMPGVLPAGTQYCAISGGCRTVPAGQELPVTVIVHEHGPGIATVEVGAIRYRAPPETMVIYNGKQAPFADYLACFPVAGMRSAARFPAGMSYCSKFSTHAN
jgi:hypothetical protein